MNNTTVPGAAIRSVRGWLAISAVTAAGLAATMPYVAPAFVWMPWAWFLGASAVLITRRATAMPALAWLIGLSFAIRSTLAGLLFAISWFKLPIFPSLQLKHGLWVFGGDGGGYQDQALGILDAWRSGIELQSIFADGGYEYRGPSLLMAAVYAVVGSLPLHFILVNAWIGAMCAVLAYLLARRIQNERSAMAAALLVAFWPSSIFWSTQLMKDSIQVALAVSALLLLVLLWQRFSFDSSVSMRLRWADGYQWIGLAGAVFGMSYLRNYLGMLLTMSVAVVMGVALARALWHRQLRQAVVAAAITLTVAVSTVAGASVDLYAMFSPPHPEIGHVARGDGFKRDHNINAALASYRRAISLNPAYAPAYRALGLTLLDRGDRDAAAAALNTYMTLESDVRERRAIAAVLAPPALLEPPVQQAERGSGRDDVSASVVRATATSSTPSFSAVDRNAVPRMLSRSTAVLRVPLGWASVKTLDYMRHVQVNVGGASVIDATTRFDTIWDVVAYTPKAFANAYLAPFPWQWLFTGGGTGFMRPVSGIEVIVIALLIPAILAGVSQRLRRFRPDEWMLVAFVAVVSLGLGLIMPNIGTLFRLRLQFLIPSLILASTALPPLAYRLVDRLAPPPADPGVADHAASA